MSENGEPGGICIRIPTPKLESRPFQLVHSMMGSAGQVLRALAGRPVDGIREPPPPLHLLPPHRRHRAQGPPLTLLLLLQSRAF